MRLVLRARCVCRASPARGISQRRLNDRSDAPVESRDPRPFLNLATAISRTDGERVLNADEVIDIHQAIRSFTINGAKMMGTQEQVGSLEVGKRAEMIFVDRNLIELAANGDIWEIAETKVQMTLFDGRVVYESPQSF